MKYPTRARAGSSWRIDEMTPDFRSYGVWALPTPGGAGDFPRLVRLFTDGDTADNPSRIARVLFAVRWKLGALLGWDSTDAGVGRRVPTLRNRLPADLHRVPAGPAFARLPFTPVYLLENEFAAEMANRTVHGVLHLRWVRDGGSRDGYHGEMGVLVKPNGLLGRLYMAAITPFRHLLVYPPLLRGIAQEWRDGAGGRPGPTPSRPAGRRAEAGPA